MDVRLLSNKDIDTILLLQDKAIANKDPFTPSSRELYERAFLFQNFVFGVFHCDRLIGYCNCSIPTHKAAINLGRDIIPNADLDMVGHINTILIDSNYRRKGYGEKLLSSVLEYFRTEKTVKYIYTTVQANNKPSYNLFIKQNFIPLKIFNNKGKDKYLLQLTIL